MARREPWEQEPRDNIYALTLDIKDKLSTVDALRSQLDHEVDELQAMALRLQSRPALVRRSA